MTAKSPPKTLRAESRKIWLQMNRLFQFEYENLLVLKTALEYYDIYVQARKELLEEGFSVSTIQGGVKTNPSLQAMNTARDGFLKSWKILNLETEPPKGVGRPPGAWPKIASKNG